MVLYMKKCLKFFFDKVTIDTFFEKPKHNLTLFYFIIITLLFDLFNLDIKLHDKIVSKSC